MLIRCDSIENQNWNLRHAVQALPILLQGVFWLWKQRQLSFARAASGEWGEVSWEETWWPASSGLHLPGVTSEKSAPMAATWLLLLSSLLVAFQVTAAKDLGE